MYLEYLLLVVASELLLTVGVGLVQVVKNFLEGPIVQLPSLDLGYVVSDAWTRTPSGQRSMVARRPPGAVVQRVLSRQLSLEVLVEPLQELQVVLVLTFDQLLNLDVLVDAQLAKALLEHLEVVDKLILRLGLHIHLGKLHLSRL